MDNFLLIFSSVGAINSLVLIAYFLTLKQGVKLQHRLIVILIFGLTLRVFKSLVHLHTGDESLTLFAIIGMAGFLIVGPAFYLFVKSVITKDTILRKTDWIHFSPAILLIFFWLIYGEQIDNHIGRRLLNSTSFTQNIIYIIISLGMIEKAEKLHDLARRNLKVIVGILLTLLVPYTLNSYSSAFHYILGALIYGAIVYLSIAVMMTRGFILEFAPIVKYEKAGIDENELVRIISQFETLMKEEKVYRDNTISLSKLARKINTNTHRLSQSINQKFHQNFFETLNDYRIDEAKELLMDPKVKTRITEIALDVGYNSLSAFYRAFKARTGITPKDFRRKHMDES